MRGFGLKVGDQEKLARRIIEAHFLHTGAPLNFAAARHADDRQNEKHYQQNTGDPPNEHPRHHTSIVRWAGRRDRQWGSGLLSS